VCTTSTVSNVCISLGFLSNITYFLQTLVYYTCVPVGHVSSFLFSSLNGLSLSLSLYVLVLVTKSLVHLVVLFEVQESRRKLTWGFESHEKIHGICMGGCKDLVG